MLSLYYTYSYTINVTFFTLTKINLAIYNEEEKYK